MLSLLWLAHLHIHNDVRYPKGILHSRTFSRNVPISRNFSAMEGTLELPDIIGSVQVAALLGTAHVPGVVSLSCKQEMRYD